jgi:CP family cyanate transporter-like MFS transporter
MALLHDWTGGFAAGWYLHLGCVLVTALLYLRFDPRSYPVAMPATG